MSCQRESSNTSGTLSNGRLKRGMLHMLPSMPLDILCEIFCFLCPADLLAIARTSKAFRRFLLKRSAMFIWRAARENVHGLPELPPDMNELQYASLVFGSVCHYKGCNRKARDTVWHLRIRSCAGCRPKHMPVKVHNSKDCITLCMTLSCPPDTLEHYLPCGPFLDSKGKPAKGFQESHVKTFKEELGILPLSEREDYLKRRRQVNEDISRFTNAGVEWQLDTKNMRILELRNRRAARAEIIRESLLVAGFQEEIDYFGWDRIRKHPLISNTRAITEKTQADVLDHLREYMLGWRELRMEEQVYAFRRQVFVEAWLQYSITAFRGAPSGCPHLPLPPNATIGFSESIDSVIRQPNPISHQSLLSQLYTAFQPACQSILEWQRTVRRDLASLLPDYKIEDNDQAVHARLMLATSIFRCDARNCRNKGRTLTYPEILFHPCFAFLPSENKATLRDPRRLANQKASLAMGGGPWSCKGRVRVHPKQYVVNKILLSCGKDPRSATAAEMDEQDPRLVCIECAVRHKVIAFMSWRFAVQHQIAFHPNSSSNRQWLMANRSTRARVNELESPESLSFCDNLSDYSVCLHCPPRIPSWNTQFGLVDLKVHIEKKHGISSPEFGKDYVFDTNITPVYLNPVKVKSIRF